MIKDYTCNMRLLLNILKLVYLLICLVNINIDKVWFQKHLLLKSVTPKKSTSEEYYR